MIRIFFIVITLIFSSLYFKTKNPLYIEVIFFFIGFSSLVLGIIKLNKHWYEKYLRIINKLSGRQIDISPLALEGKKFGAVVEIFVSILLLIFLFLFFIFPILINPH
jgi:hypothetical protein